MSATPTRVPLSEAHAIAVELYGRLAPFCERLDICGSIRRRAPEVGDIDLIAIPKHEPIPDLFGSTTGHLDLLDHQLDELCGSGILPQARRPDGGPIGWGKRLKHAVYEGMRVQIQSAAPECYGMWMLIRTGPAAYAHQWVMTVDREFAVRSRATKRVTEYRSGLLPRGWSVEDGFKLHRAHIFVPTPEEQDVFDAVGRPYLPPEHRR